MKIKITSVIPVANYANIQPELEVDMPTYDEALEYLQPKVNELWDKYYNNIPTASGGIELTDFFGNKIIYDDLTHSYSFNGEKYLSGSEFAESFEKPFDKDGISSAMAKRDGREQQSLLDEWELNGEVSGIIGTALHKALELFGVHGKLTNSPILKNAVQSFYASHKGKADYEVLIVDHKAKRAGRVDRLADGWIEDFKTDYDLTKKLAKYSKQLNFYRSICEANGLPIKGMRVYHWTGQAWDEYELKKEAV